MLIDNKPLIFDPNGTVIYGSKYLDLAIIAIEFSGYFNSDWDKSGKDKVLFESFISGYGEIDFDILYHYIILRGIERWWADELIGNVKEMTKYCYNKTYNN